MRAGELRLWRIPGSGAGLSPAEPGSGVSFDWSKIHDIHDLVTNRKPAFASGYHILRYMKRSGDKAGNKITYRKAFMLSLGLSLGYKIIRKCRYLNVVFKRCVFSLSKRKCAITKMDMPPLPKPRNTLCVIDVSDFFQSKRNKNCDVNRTNDRHTSSPPVVNGENTVVTGNHVDFQ